MQQEASNHAKEDHDVVIVCFYPKDSSIRPKRVGFDRDEENFANTLSGDKRDNVTKINDKREDMVRVLLF